ncbi:MAG: hypothetical protein H6668_15675 [Ardenticatenaceae bacterium]|nr:hypothetical protein [Ardenticatenaceae bacterium]
MKRFFIKQVVILLIVVWMIGCGGRETAVSEIQSTLDKALASPYESAISQVTVQITMIFEDLQETTATGDGETVLQISQTVAYGLGTLLTSNEHILLITHDHWPHGVPATVQFFHTTGSFLLEMSGESLYQHLLFRDSGTLILEAPTALTTLVPAATMTIDTAQLQVGDTVEVIQRTQEDRQKTVVTSAQILSIDTQNRVPLLTLRSQDGSSVEPGDSGGGVWKNGRFVGNMWFTVRYEQEQANQTRLVSTDLSQAAGFTNLVIELSTIAVEAKEAPALTPDTAS